MSVSLHLHEHLIEFGEAAEERADRRHRDGHELIRKRLIRRREIPDRIAKRLVEAERLGVAGRLARRHGRWFDVALEDAVETLRQADRRRLSARLTRRCRY